MFSFFISLRKSVRRSLHITSSLLFFGFFLAETESSVCEFCHHHMSGAREWYILGARARRAMSIDGPFFSEQLRENDNLIFMSFSYVHLSALVLWARFWQSGLCGVNGSKSLCLTTCHNPWSYGEKSRKPHTKTNVKTQKKLSRWNWKFYVGKENNRPMRNEVAKLIKFYFLLSNNYQCGFLWSVKPTNHKNLSDELRQPTTLL